MRAVLSLSSGLALLLAAGCGSPPASGTGGAGAGTLPATTGAGAGPACALEGTSFEPGDPKGHADPLGAKAAKQARAGRIDDVAQIAQPAHGRQRIEKGDFLLIND